MFTDFGFKKVLESQKQKLVENLFQDVSQKYDLMNDLMSAGLHRLWKKHFIRMISLPHKPQILDLAGGTGDIALGLLKHHHYLSPHVTVCDLTQGMMQQGRNKAIDQGVVQNIDWVCGSGEELPFPDQSFDCVTISFGLRNTTHKDKVLKEAWRCLKDNGKFYCLEFSKPTCASLSYIYDLYSFNVIPLMGQMVANDRESYQYLVESIRAFPDQETLKNMMLDAGFVDVCYENLNQGIVAIHQGTKAHYVQTDI